MASTLNLTSPKQRKHFPIERRPTMLKDFLLEDLNSCSSSGFKSFPRRTPENNPTPVILDLIEIDLSPAKNPRRRRTRSSAFRAVINAVTSIHFAAVKSPSILPRSLSRRLSSKRNNSNSLLPRKEAEVKVTVRVKDIIRWRSFQDLIEEEKSPQLDFAFACSPHHHRTTTTTTTTSSSNTSSSSSSSNSSSWCDSDFTSEFLPPWGGNSSEDQGGEGGRKYLPAVGKENKEKEKEKGKDAVKPTTESSRKTEMGPKEELECEEKDYNSPVSILDCQFEDYDGGSASSFDQSLTSIQEAKQKLVQKLHRFEILAKVDPLNLDEWMSSTDNNNNFKDEEDRKEKEYDVEVKAMEMLSNVKVMCSIWSCKSHIEQLLLDFFADELTANTSNELMIDEKSEMELMKRAKAWVKGEDRFGIEVNRDACVREMDKRGKWDKLEEEKNELVLEIESDLLEILIEDALFDICF